jgi:hypothetical protein
MPSNRRFDGRWDHSRQPANWSLDTIPIRYGRVKVCEDQQLISTTVSFFFLFPFDTLAF